MLNVIPRRSSLFVSLGFLSLCIPIRVIMIEYCDILDLAVCRGVDCGYAVSLNAVGRHMRESHNMGIVEAQVVETKLVEQQEAIPALEVLPVRDCFKCSGCSYIAPSAKTVRKHMSKHVAGTAGYLVRCKGQTILSGKRTRYFEVEETNGDGIRGILEEMEALEGSKPSSVRELDVSRMDAFLAEMRFDMHLKSAGFSLEEGFHLAKWRKEGVHLELRRTVGVYMKRAFNLSRERMYIKGHMFMEQQLQLAMSTATLEKYEGRISRLLSFMVEICGLVNGKWKKIIPSNVRDDLQIVARSGSEDRAMGQKGLHSIQW